MTSADIKQLGSIAKQIRGILTGIDKLPEACDELERRERACDQREAQQEQLQTSIERLTAEDASAQQSLARIQQTLANWKATLHEQERRKAERMEELDAQIAAKEQTLAALHADLDHLRGKHFA
jgi:chromosome segregation ATPase